jgi:hypothetical protein
MLLKQLVTVCFSGILLASCASTEERSGPEDDLANRGSDCISIRTIRDYTPLDRSNLIIEGSGKRLYYVTLMMSSFEMRSSFRIGVQSRDEWLCPYGGDSLVFDGFDNFEVGIRDISRISPEQAEELLYRYGKKERPEQEDQAPPKIEGAEVEELGEVG